MRALGTEPSSAGLHGFIGGLDTFARSVCRPVALGSLFSGNSKFAEVLESDSRIVAGNAGPFGSGFLACA